MRGRKHRPLTFEEKRVQKNLWTAEKRRQQRAFMEAAGLWTPLGQKDEWGLYKIQSNWMKPMVDLLDPHELKLLHRYGMFDIRKNKNGMVRHHLFSRAEGFKQKVFPVILRHPSNCGLLHNHVNHRHRGCDLTLSQLFARIERWCKPWLEQEDCLRSISRYRAGERWSKSEQQ
jgi:hypothetical protein